MKILGLLNVIGNLVVGGTINGKVINNFLTKSDVIDNTSSTLTDAPFSANQGRILQLQISSLGDMKVVADDTERDALTGLSKGDMVHVENGGNWIRWQILTITDGTWATSTKIVIATFATAGGTNLGYVPSTRTITSDTGADTVLPLVVANGDAGLMSGTDKTKLDFISVTQAVNLDTMESDIAVNNAKVSNVTTDLSIANRNTNTLDVVSSDGTDATIPAVTTSLSGLMTGSDKTKLDGISAGADVTVTALNNASLTAVTVATDDKILIKDTSDSNNLKTVTAGSLKPELQKTLVLESPVATDDILLMELSKAITITKVTHQIFGATNVSFNISHSVSTDLWASDKVSTTTKTSETSFTDATCTANNQVRYQASAITGTPTKIEVTVTYTED